MDNKTRALELVHGAISPMVTPSVREWAWKEIERVLDEACGDAWDAGNVASWKGIVYDGDPNPYKKNSGLGQAKGEVQSVSDPATEPTRVHSDVTGSAPFPALLWASVELREGALRIIRKTRSTFVIEEYLSAGVDALGERVMRWVWREEHSIPTFGYFVDSWINAGHPLVTAEGVSCEKKSGPGLGDVRVCTSGENPHQTKIETLEDNAELAVQEGGQQ